MKTLKYFLFFLFVLVAGTGFTSCSDDDENVESSSLVGLWEVTWTEGYSYDTESPEDNDEWSEALSGVKMKFNSDGTGYEGSESDTFTWKLEGNQLTIVSSYYTEVSTVLKLTDSELKLEYQEKDDSYSHYEILTFKKVG